jgi:hypothetical protein
MDIFRLLGELGLIYGQEVFDAKIHSIFMTYVVNTAASVRNMGV